MNENPVAWSAWSVNDLEAYYVAPYSNNYVFYEVHVCKKLPRRISDTITLLSRNLKIPETIKTSSIRIGKRSYQTPE